MEYLNTANQYFVEENYTKAIEEYTNATRKLVGLNQFPALFGRARARIISNDIKNAIDDLAQCISIDKEHQLCNYYLGYHLMKINTNNIEEIKKAHRYLLQATKGPVKQGRFENALKECTQLIEKLEPKVKITQSKNEDEKSQEKNKNVDTDNSNKLPSIRDNWYQNSGDISYTLYVKGLTKNDVQINFFPKQLSCQLKLPNNLEYTRTLTLLHEIVPEKCKFTVNEFKINITLVKKNSGEWKTLEEASIHNKNNTNSTPWTTKRNWETLNQQLKEEIESDKPQGDEALNQLFQKIYGDADENQRRAMVKSFQTSGGTVLSTNWDDVKKKDYEGKDKVLPTGQDVHKYEF